MGLRPLFCCRRKLASAPASVQGCCTLIARAEWTKARALQEIAEIKLPDLNAVTVEAAMRIVEGTAKNMGVTVSD